MWYVYTYKRYKYSLQKVHQRTIIKFDSAILHKKTIKRPKEIPPQTQHSFHSI